MDTLEVRAPSHSPVGCYGSCLPKVKERGVESGLCIVYVPHTTVGILINEGADPAVMKDVEETLERLVPGKGGTCTGKGTPPLTSSPSSWEVAFRFWWKTENCCWAHGRIFLCEFDGPRTRRIHIKLLRG